MRTLDSECFPGHDVLPAKGGTPLVAETLCGKSVFAQRTVVSLLTIRLESNSVLHHCVQRKGEVAARRCGNVVSLQIADDDVK